MFTLLLDTLILFTLTTPLMGLIGRKIKREEVVVPVHVTVSLISSLVTIGLFYSDVLWENVSLFVYEKSLPPEGA
ncbi:MAG: hypothetical protein NWF14_00115, partial [Candidatus Bathyarchaeota archaeon]|nr:hypothetical protein [Candidatus Bathyarchaeota archaeon]